MPSHRLRAILGLLRLLRVGTERHKDCNSAPTAAVHRVATFGLVGIVLFGAPALAGPKVSIEDASGFERERALEFSVTLSYASRHDYNVSYATSDGDAAAGEDYDAATGQLYFEPYQTRATFTVPIIHDGIVEADETFAVELSDFTGVGGIDRGKATGTIKDSGFPRLSIGDASGPEDTVGKLEFAVTLHAAGDKPVTVVYWSRSRTATAGSDFREAYGSLTFEPGETAKTVEVEIVADDIAEPDETFWLQLYNNTNATLAKFVGVGTIEADDPFLQVTEPMVSEDEGPMEFHVTVGGLSALGSSVAVAYQTEDGTAVAGSDYSTVSDTRTFAPGEGGFGVSVAILDDEAVEADETFDLVVTMNALTVRAAGRILDDDSPKTITLTADPTRVSEGADATPVTVTASLDGDARTKPTVVAVTVTGSGDPDVVGFAAVPDFAITIAKGARNGTGTFTLTPEDDGVDERDETLTVGGTSDLAVTGTEVELEDDDETSSTITLTASPLRMLESDGATQVAVTASLDAGARTDPMVVAVSVTGSGDPDAVDFAAVPDFAITIAKGARNGTGTFTLTPEDDGVDEPDETLTVDGMSDLAVTGTEVELVDDDETSSTIALTASPLRMLESDGATPVAVTASLDAGARTDPMVVAVSVTGSGDPDAVDFAAVPDFAITIAAGSRSGTETFAVIPEDDEVDETDELLSVSGAADLPVSTAPSVTLVDDEQTSTEIHLSAVPSTVSEDADSTPVTVTAALDGGARTMATTVAVTVTGSGDPDAVDFAAVPDFAITIAAGATSGTGTFTLTPEDDGVMETGETLTVAGTADLHVTDASVAVTDDDVASTRILLSTVPERVSEGRGAVPVAVTASFNGAARTVATTVAVSVTGSGDPDAVDFAAVPDFAITIAAGATSGTGTFTLTPEDDGIMETGETLTVSGTSDLPVTPAAVVLGDDDEASTRILLSTVPERVSEGDGATPVRVTATLDRGGRQRATAVTVTVAGSGDPDAADFAAVPDFEIVIPAESTNGSGTFTLTPADDATVESDESLTVSGKALLPVEPAAVTLVDDDEVTTRILLFLAVDPPQALEGDGAVRVTVTAAVDRGVRAVETRIAVRVSGSGDPGAVDFAAVPDFEIVIPAYAPRGTGTFTVLPEDDLVAEADEVLTVSGTADLPVTPATLRLLDDDEASARILLSAEPSRVSEGGGPAAVTVTASLDRGLRREATTVTVSVSGGGDPDAVDFAEVPAFGITIAANAQGGTGAFTLTPEDDAEDEADETLALTGKSDLPVQPATVLLVDDDEAQRVLSVADAEVAESATEIVFPVTLDGPSVAVATVNYSTAEPADPAGPVARAGDDYGKVAGMLTFAPGAVAATIRVPIFDDQVDEPDETFLLVLSEARGVKVDRGTAWGIIVDDDEPPALSIADASGTEGVGELAFPVTLSARSLAAVTVDYASMDGTAVAGGDYGAVGGTLTFAPGETAMTIRVPVVDDLLDEANEESFAVTLSAPVGATLDAGAATGAIRDDDAPPALSVADAAGGEDAGSLEFAVTLDAPSGLAVSLTYATTDGTATAGSDYAAASGTLALAPGEVSGTIRVAILDDGLDEADEETFALTLSALENATAADGSATGTIRDDDLAPPAVAGQLPAALLCVGGAAYELDLAKYFGGKELVFSAVPSTPRVATATLAGSRLTVAPVSEGESTVTVTAVNAAGTAGGSIGVRVVADPAELEAVDSVLASIGRGVLTGVTASVRARFVLRSAFEGPGAFGQDSPTPAGGDRSPVLPDAGAAVWNQWPGPPTRGTRSGAWDATGMFESRDPLPGTTNRRGMVPFSFSLDSAGSGSTGPAWAVWGRGDTHRYESGIDGTSHDGALTTVHLGVDARVGDWLAGVSVSRAAAQADYRFERSVDACGGAGSGEGKVDAALTGVHPYAGHRVGRGWVWAALGAGGGEVSVERCETGQRGEADLSMRLAALGGRHPFAGGDRIEVSVLEEIGVLALTTGDAPGPVGDRAVTVGQARLGLEVAGVAPADCECSLATFARAFARGDWGDGATGAGLELAAGLRYRDLPRRLGIDIGIRALAVHSAADAVERSADLTFSILPRADGTGWRASLGWRRQAGGFWPDPLDGIPPWTAAVGGLPDAERHWIVQSRFGYGIALRPGAGATRRTAMPFVEFDAGRSESPGARFGVRHEFGDRVRGLVVEWRIEQHGPTGAGNRMVLEALGRF